MLKWKFKFLTNYLAIYCRNCSGITVPLLNWGIQPFFFFFPIIKLMTLEDIFPKKESFVQINYPSFWSPSGKISWPKKKTLADNLYRRCFLEKLTPKLAIFGGKKIVGIAIFRSQVLLVCGPLLYLEVGGFQTNLLLFRTHSQI